MRAGLLMLVCLPRCSCHAMLTTAFHGVKTASVAVCGLKRARPPTRKTALSGTSGRRMAEGCLADVRRAVSLCITVSWACRGSWSI